jgi:hypothetical protein
MKKIIEILTFTKKPKTESSLTQRGLRISHTVPVEENLSFNDTFRHIHNERLKMNK